MTDIFAIGETCIILAAQLAMLGNKPDKDGVLMRIELSRKTFLNVATEASKVCIYPDENKWIGDKVQFNTNHGAVVFVPKEVTR